MSPKARVTDTNNLALQKIAPLIHEIRDERVILDSDLAVIYGVPVKALNQAEKETPTDFRRISLSGSHDRSSIL